MKSSALSAELLRTFLVTIAFLLLSRQLTLEEVGVISAITAALAIIGPIATLGLPFRVLRGSAQGGIGLNYRNALLTVCVVTGPVFVVICFLVVHSYASNVAVFAVILLVCSECWLLIAFQMLTSYALGAAKPRVLLSSTLFSSLPRFAASAVLLLNPAPSLELYSLSLASLAVPATVASILVLPNQGALRILSLRDLFAERRAGGLSTTSSLLSRCSDDFDKLLLGFIRGAEEVAIYSIPYRLTFYAMIPGRAYLSSKLGGWYGREGRGVKSEVLSVLAAASGFGFLLSAVVYFAWPSLCAHVIGEKFSEAQPLVVAFGVAVTLRGIHYSLGEVLFARLAMLERNTVQLLAVVSGILGMIILIPDQGVLGAAWATVLIETITLLGYLVVLHEKR